MPDSPNNRIYVSLEEPGPKDKKSISSIQRNRLQPKQSLSAVFSGRCRRARWLFIIGSFCVLFVITADALVASSLNDSSYIATAFDRFDLFNRPRARIDVKVLLYSAYWGNHNEFHGLRPSNCSYPIEDGFDYGSDWCMISRNRSDTQSAGLLLFHSRDISADDLPKERILHQPWVYFTTESWHNEVAWDSSVINDKDLMAKFDLSATYALNSDIPQAYETKVDFASTLRDPLVNLTSKRSLAMGRSPVLWIGSYEKFGHRTNMKWLITVYSNCEATSGRHHYIQELMKHIPVDSYGSCLHNKDVPEGFPGRYSSNDLSYLSTLIKDYKFYLALENSNCPDYVTEKYFNALRAGVLPIVDGPPGGYRGFAPTNRSIIELDNFRNPKDLADFLKKLDADDTLYKSYFDYKAPTNAPFEETFQKKWTSKDVEQDRGWCGLCREAARSLHKRRKKPDLVTQTATEGRPPIKDSMRPNECAPAGKFNYLQQEQQKEID